MGDEQLLARWQGGDTQAGTLLLERHRSSLGAFFGRRVPSDEAQELLQETLTTLCAARGRVQSSFRAFAFGVARRKLLEHGRARARYSPMPDDMGEQIASDEPWASSVVDSKRVKNVVIAALRSLPLDEQFLLQMSEYEGLKRRELAEVFDVPMGSVGGKVYRARGRLMRTVERLMKRPADVASTETSLHSYWSGMEANPPEFSTMPRA